MLGERLAPCWCYSSIHFEWRRKRVQGHALVRQSVTLNTPCDVDQRIYFTPWRDTGLVCARVSAADLRQRVAKAVIKEIQRKTTTIVGDKVSPLISQPTDQYGGNGNTELIGGVH